MSRIQFTGPLIDGDMEIQPFRAQCSKCKLPIFFNIAPGGTPGRNGDWFTAYDSRSGDYGCATEDELFGNGHAPTDIEYDPYLVQEPKPEIPIGRVFKPVKPTKRRTIIVEKQDGIYRRRSKTNCRDT